MSVHNFLKWADWSTSESYVELTTTQLTGPATETTLETNKIEKIKARFLIFFTSTPSVFASCPKPIIVLTNATDTK